MRCRACNIKLDEADLMRKAKDWDFCSNCRFLSNKQYNADDHQYHHLDVTGVPLDGSSISLEDYEKSAEST